jgi:hypothetical protein
MKSVGEERDQIPEHVAGAGKAVQQQQLRRVITTRLAIKNLETIDIGRAVADRRHQTLLCSKRIHERSDALARRSRRL